MITDGIKKLLARIDAFFIRRVLRFGITGVWNTGFSYAVYALGIFLGAPYYIALLVSWIAGAINNYFTFGIFVFGDRPKAPVLRYLVGFVAGYLFATATTGFFIHIVGFNPYLANAVAIPIIAAFSFSVNNWFVFR